MGELIIWTYDWVPAGPRGFVRDLRLRWACEEAGLAYTVRTVPFEDRETNHLAQQPFGQVPFLQDGSLELFESGAGLLHLARKSEVLMPRDPAGEAETLQWTIAALNSIEMVSVPWWFLGLSIKENNPLEGWLGQRLGHMERVLGANRRFNDLLKGKIIAKDVHLFIDKLLRVYEAKKQGEETFAQFTDRVKKDEILAALDWK